MFGGSIKRNKIQLVKSPFWLKIEPCPSELDKIDLIKMVRAMFREAISSKVNGDYYRFRVIVNVNKPLRKGIFVEGYMENQKWLLFKYENLPSFCFGYGKLGHTLINCVKISADMKELPEDKLPFSIVLKVELNIIGGVSFKLGAKVRNRVYLGYPECPNVSDNIIT